MVLRAGSGNSAADGANRSANHHTYRAGNQANQGTCHTAAKDASDQLSLPDTALFTIQENRI